MPPRRRTRSARIESTDDVVVVSLDDDEPPNTRRRRTEPALYGGTCCFPACNLPVGGGVSANSAYPTFTDEDAKCCDRCHKMVLADRLACTHPGFPQRECIHPQDPTHLCSFTNKPENMEKWKEWATFRESPEPASRKLRLACEVSQLIGESQCLRCAGAFVERCNVLLHVLDGDTSAYRENVEEMVSEVLRMLFHPTISSQGRTAIVQTLFVDWWNSDRMRLSSSHAFTNHANLVKSIRIEDPLCLVKVLSEEHVQWWSTRLFCYFADDDLTEAFKLMIKDMKRTLEHLSGSDAEHMRSSYVTQIADIIKSYLHLHNEWLNSVRPDDPVCRDDFVPMTIEEIERCPFKTEFQKYIENCKDDWSRLGGHCILNDVVDAIDFPKELISTIEEDIFRDEFESDQYPLGYVRKNLWFASLCTDRCFPVSFHRSRVKEQMHVIQLLFHLDQNESLERLYLSTILDILVKRFPPFVINPTGFAMGVAQGIKFAVPNTAPILKVFLDNMKMRCRSREIDPAFYGCEQLNDHVIQMWASSGDSGNKIDHSQLMQSMLHAWAIDGSRMFFDRDTWSTVSVSRILFPKATDFPPEIREHENFWIPENTKEVALKSVQSVIDEYKEEIPNGVYLSMMNSLMTQWRQE